MQIQGALRIKGLLPFQEAQDYRILHSFLTYVLIDDAEALCFRHQPTGLTGRCAFFVAYTDIGEGREIIMVRVIGRSQ